MQLIQISLKMNRAVSLKIRINCQDFSLIMDLILLIVLSSRVILTTLGRNLRKITT